MPFCGVYGFQGGFGILGMFFMFLLPVLFILLLVWIVYAVIAREGGEKGLGGRDREMRIAKERYAKGEITKEEYEEIIKILQK